MKAILHIGTPKTGTSTIQNFIIEHRELLQRQKIHTPPGVVAITDDEGCQYKLGREHFHLILSWLCRKSGTSPHFTIAVDHSDEKLDKDAVKKRVYEAMVADWSSLPSGTEKVLFSCEAFYELRSIDDIRRLKEYLSPHFSEIKIIVYLRDQWGLLTSFNSQIRKQGFVEPLFSDTILKHYLHWIDYRHSLSMWSEVFSPENIIVKPFIRKEFVQENLLNDFASIVGYTFDETQKTGDENLSINAEAAEYLRTLNAMPGFGRVSSDGTPNISRDFLIKDLERHYSGKCPALSKSDVIEIAEKFRESNDWVARTFLNREHLFPEPDLSKYPEERPAMLLTVEKCVEISATLMKTLFEKQRDLSSRLNNSETTCRDLQNQLGKVQSNVASLNKTIERQKQEAEEKERLLSEKHLAYLKDLRSGEQSPGDYRNALERKIRSQGMEIVRMKLHTQKQERILKEQHDVIFRKVHERVHEGECLAKSQNYVAYLTEKDRQQMAHIAHLENVLAQADLAGKQSHIAHLEHLVHEMRLRSRIRRLAVKTKTLWIARPLYHFARKIRNVLLRFSFLKARKTS